MLTNLAWRDDDNRDDDNEALLERMGLPSPVIHDGVRRGLTRASNRTGHAVDTARGTDIYHDSMEDLSRILITRGWTRRNEKGQRRLVHPDGLFEFSVTAARRLNGGSLRPPYTNRKGTATRESLGSLLTSVDLLPGLTSISQNSVQAGQYKPKFYFLLIERVAATKIDIELSTPRLMDDSGRVVGWGERIGVRSLDLDGDLAIFKGSDADDDGGGGDLDVSVTPR